MAVAEEEPAGQRRYVSDVGSQVDDLLPDLDRAFLLANMRAQPLQPRALVTVERIIVAARRIAIGGGYDALTLQAVSEGANVRLGAIYRYFSTPDDLIRMMVRLWVAGQFARYRAKIAEARFHSVEAIVDHMLVSIDRVSHVERMEPGISRNLLMRLMRDFHDVPLAEQWAMAGFIRAKALADGVAIAEDADAHARLAMAFAATSTFAKATMLNAPQLLGSAYFTDTLRRLLRDALLPQARLPGGI